MEKRDQNFVGPESRTLNTKPHGHMAFGSRARVLKWILLHMNIRVV